MNAIRKRDSHIKEEDSESKSSDPSRSITSTVTDTKESFSSVDLSAGDETSSSSSDSNNSFKTEDSLPESEEEKDSLLY